MTTLLTSAVFFASSLLFTASAALAEPAVSLPSTDSGKCAAAFIAMMNDGTPDSIRYFEKSFASKTRLGRMSMEERVKRLGAMRGEWGNCALTEVVASNEKSLTTSLKLKDGSLAEVEFQFSKSEPGKLDVMMIQVESGAGLTKLTPEITAKTVEAAAKALQEKYVYPEVADKMAKSITDKLKAGEYSEIANESRLARKLTADLRDISHDKHLGVMVSVDEGKKDSMAASSDGRAEMRRDNFAFRKVEILPGNVGYLRFDGFVEDAEANKTAAAAMEFLSHCDSIVYDLRSNGGGSPEMIRFLSSYLFHEPTHLNDMVDRNGKVIEEYWTLKEVPGPRLPKEIPVYVLCSGMTFSGAEEFCYNLKNLKRATIVGEVTGGGAHPTEAERINEHFVVRIPFMRACNPISKTNWEGTGVKPDVECAAADALDKALELAKQSTAQSRN